MEILEDLSEETKTAYRRFLVVSASTEIRTPVLALKGLRPGPLDDGGINEQDFTRASPNGQALDINSFYFPGGDFSQALILQC